MHVIWLQQWPGLVIRDARKLNRTVVLSDLDTLEFRVEHGLISEEYIQPRS